MIEQYGGKSDRRFSFLVRLLRDLVGFAVLLTLFAATPRAAWAAERSGAILVAEVRGAIGVAATRIVADALAKARQENARCLVIELDTPGGLVSATRDIIRMPQ